jgi:hypothetical protein
MEEPGKPFGTLISPLLLSEFRARTKTLGISQREAAEMALRSWLKVSVPAGTPADLFYRDGATARINAPMPPSLLSRLKVKSAQRRVKIYEAVAEALEAWLERTDLRTRKVAARKEAAK